MTASSRFHDLRVARISSEAAGSIAIALSVPDELLERFDFQPGQYLTLRSKIDGADVRRSYSICGASANWWWESAPWRAECFPTGPRTA